MSDIAIKVENLHKLYRLGLKDETKDTLAATMVSWLKAPQKNFKQLRSLGHFDLNSNDPDVLHALNDVSFEVKHGEVLGIIGRNGAGKSTLLKVLSRITAPTAGRVTINGRVASLLEVGTGFHPELSGRENIYMNGTILGMTKKEIDRKFDEIVEFSGVEKFLDTPIKRYSSGMKVRLAFSVAAHLEPEILIIDEVLAVGDAEFQRKCLGKMQEVSKGGRTVIFVSHQMDAVLGLCNIGLYLENGAMKFIGVTAETVNRYFSDFKSTTRKTLRKRIDRTGNGDIRFVDTWLEGISGNKVDCVSAGDYLKICASYEVNSDVDVKSLEVAFLIKSINDVPLVGLSNNPSNQIFENIKKRQGIVECVIPCFPLNKGTYCYSLWARANGCVADSVERVSEITVESSNFFKTGKLPDEKWPFLISNSWHLREVGEGA